MVLPLLSVFLMGMVPASLPMPAEPTMLSDFAISAPAVAADQPDPNVAKALSASGFLIADLDSGQELFGRNENVRRPIASLTKLMADIIITENHSLDEIVTIPAIAEHTEGQSLHLKTGEKYTVGDLLTASLVYSSNDATMALAIYHSGSEAAFVHEMNTRATMLGLKDTSFANPIGLDEENHYSTLHDLQWLVTYALRSKDIASRMAMPKASITSLDGRVVSFEHTHELLHKPSAVLMGKTGTTPDAGQCLISIVGESGGRRYVVILLSSNDRYADMRIVLKALIHLPA